MGYHSYAEMKSFTVIPKKFSSVNRCFSESLTCKNLNTEKCKDCIKIQGKWVNYDKKDNC